MSVSHCNNLLSKQNCQLHTWVTFFPKQYCQFHTAATCFPKQNCQFHIAATFFSKTACFTLQQHSFQNKTGSFILKQLFFAQQNCQLHIAAMIFPNQSCQFHTAATFFLKQNYQFHTAATFFPKLVFRKLSFFYIATTFTNIFHLQKNFFILQTNTVSIGAAFVLFSFFLLSFSNKNCQFYNHYICCQVTFFPNKNWLSNIEAQSFPDKDCQLQCTTTFFSKKFWKLLQQHYFPSIQKQQSVSSCLTGLAHCWHFYKIIVIIYY